MRICCYEDASVETLEPVTLTRPAYELRCGAESIQSRQLRVLGAREFGAWIRPCLVDLVRQRQPSLVVNRPEWVMADQTLWTNARWLPGENPTFPSEPFVGVVGDQIACALLPEGEHPVGKIEDWLETIRHRLPIVEVGGQLFEFLWEIIDANCDATRRDIRWFSQKHGDRLHPNGVSILGSRRDLVLAEDAVIEPFVTIDTRKGPVLLDRGAIVHSFSRIEGPCYLGENSWVMGANLRGVSIGPNCRVGGEVEATIMMGNSNKYHDGFLGHSYLGEWINLAAGTQTSDLRNDYENVRTSVAGKRVNCRRNKVGSMIGDHTKTALGSLLNTGSVIGAFCNLLPGGGLLPQIVPSFCQVQQRQIAEHWDLRRLFDSAATMMRRRGQQLSDLERDFFYDLFETTMLQRRKTLRDLDVRKARKASV